MSWMPIIDRELTEDEIREGFSAVLGVGPEDIVFVEDILEISGNVPDEVPVVIEKSRAGGDFPQRLDIVLRGNKLWERDEADNMRFFCRRMSCSCLVGDDTLDPERWVLIEPTGKTRVVIVDGEAIDERDEYIIDHDAVDTWPDSGFWESRFRNPSD